MHIVKDIYILGNAHCEGYIHVGNAHCEGYIHVGNAHCFMYETCVTVILVH